MSENSNEDQEKIDLKDRLSKAQEALLKIAELDPGQQAYHNTETIKQIALKGLI